MQLKQATSSNKQVGRRVKSSRTNLPKRKQNQQKSKVVSVVRAPVSISQRSRTGDAVIRQSRNGKCVHITHREYFMDIVGNKETYIPATLDQSKFLGCEITPTNAQIFPWLSKMAKLYEQYSFEQLSFEYQPYQATSSAGVVLMAIDYDPSDDYPYSKSDMLAYDGAERTSIWAPTSLRAPKSKLNTMNRYFVKSSTTSLSSDASMRQTSVGTFYATSVSCPAGLDGLGLGELYVSYTISFYIPQLTSTFYDQFTSAVAVNSSGDPTGFFWLPGSSIPVTIRSTFPYNILTKDSISINQAYDALLVIVSKTGTGITDAPSLSYGGDITSVAVLVNWVDVSHTHGVRIEEIKVRNPGANLLLLIETYTTLTGLYCNIIAKPVVPVFFGPTLT